MIVAGCRQTGKVLVLGAVLAGLALVAAACGSSSMVGTSPGGTGATATTGAGPLVAALYPSCSTRVGVVVDRSPTGGAATPAEALTMFLSSSPHAASVGGQRFDPATPPPTDQPVQSVPAAPTSSGLTTSTTTALPPEWFAHRDAQGRVTAIVEVSFTAGWAVDQLEECTPGREVRPQPETATTGAAAPGGPSGAATTIVPPSTTLTSTMSGP